MKAKEKEGTLKMKNKRINDAARARQQRHQNG
jgi:hypothetical protein